MWFLHHHSPKNIAETKFKGSQGHMVYCSIFGRHLCTALYQVSCTAATLLLVKQARALAQTAATATASPCLHVPSKFVAVNKAARLKDDRHSAAD